MRVIVDRIWMDGLDTVSPSGEKLLINTVNAYGFNLAHADPDYRSSLLESDILLPDGVGAVLAGRVLAGSHFRKVSGYDLFIHEMEELNSRGGRCFFLGSSEKVLDLIRDRAAREYPDVEAAFYSPPYKAEFSADDNRLMLEAVNAFRPDVLFVGMTAPKQEKWSAAHFDGIVSGHVCSIGAVFDFYAGTVERAPAWMISIGLEWFYRLIREPRRMWRRYVIGNPRFLWLLLRAKLSRRQPGIRED